MMNIRVEFSSQLALQAGGREQTLELPEGSTLRMAIQRLAEQHGESFALFVGGSDRQDIRRTLLAAVDGEQVHDVDERVLEDGNELMLLMPMAGG